MTYAGSETIKNKLQSAVANMEVDYEHPYVFKVIAPSADIRLLKHWVLSKGASFEIAEWKEGGVLLVEISDPAASLLENKKAPLAE